MKLKLITLALISTLTLTGCARNLSGTGYSAQEARKVQQVQFGTVIDAQPAKLAGSSSQVGTMAGGATGAIAGSSIGGSRDSLVGGILGGVAGAALGGMAEQKLTSQDGVEITIQLQNGSYISIVQGLEPGVTFNAGDDVRILTQGNTNRVVKM